MNYLEVHCGCCGVRPVDPSEAYLHTDEQDLWWLTWRCGRCRHRHYMPAGESTQAAAIEAGANVTLGSLLNGLISPELLDPTRRLTAPITEKYVGLAVDQLDYALDALLRRADLDETGGAR